MQPNNFSLEKTARLTGLLYFLVAIMGTLGYFVLRSKLFEQGNIAGTAEKMLANEFLFRTSIAISIIGNILFLSTIVFLYQLLKKVHQTIATLMLWFAVIAIPVFFIQQATEFTVFFIFKGDLLTSFSPEQTKEIAASLLNFSDNIGQIITFHWGLWLLPMGWLVYKSVFIPKILGILLVINGLGYMIASITFILWPDSLKSVSKIVYPTYFAGELPLIIWLVIKGVKSEYVLQSENSK